jgi:hypothetical protein
MGTHSATLEVTTKTAKLEPLHKQPKISFAVKTKAGIFSVLA